MELDKDYLNLKQELNPTYLKYLNEEIVLETENLLNIEISRAQANKECIFPKRNDIFRIFKECEINNIKVVILGQDVYHSSPDQANGIAFSVNEGVKYPPSLKNIHKELLMCYPDTEIRGDLSHWVKNGVFLLNCSLTVLQGKPGSHIHIWKNFTDDVIKVINEYGNKGIVFCLWGKFGESKEHLIDSSRHNVLKCSHPSPLSAYKTKSPFIGSRIFTKINEHLENPILW